MELKWIPNQILQYNGSSGASKLFKYHSENKFQLRWNQDKIDKLWKGVKDYYYDYNIQIDPRFLLAIIIEEGTGSFNTNSVSLAPDGGYGVQTNYSDDLMVTNALIFGKILGYTYYGKDFRTAVSNNNYLGNGINGNGNIFQYVNWVTPIIDLNHNSAWAGLYAGGALWGDDVKKIYKDLGGDPAGYESYISSIGTSSVNQIAKKFNIVLTSFTFKPDMNSVDLSGNPNQMWTIIAQ